MSEVCRCQFIEFIEDLMGCAGHNGLFKPLVLLILLKKSLQNYDVIHIRIK